jgi:hypothetical protein
LVNRTSSSARVSTSERFDGDNITDKKVVRRTIGHHKISKRIGTGRDGRAAETATFITTHVVNSTLPFAGS